MIRADGFLESYKKAYELCHFSGSVVHDNDDVCAHIYRSGENDDEAFLYINKSTDLNAKQAIELAEWIFYIFKEV
jgi:hypothetical protein